MITLGFEMAIAWQAAWLIKEGFAAATATVATFLLANQILQVY